MQLIILSFYKKKLLELCNSHSSPLFKKSFILKFLGNFNLENTLFISKSINSFLPSVFSDWFLFSSDQYNYETSWSYHGNLQKPSYKTNIYDKNSIIVSAINAWNNSQKHLKISLRHLSPNKIKKLCQMPFLQSIEIIFKFQIFQIDA